MLMTRMQSATSWYGRRVQPILAVIGWLPLDIWNREERPGAPEPGRSSRSVEVPQPLTAPEVNPVMICRSAKR